jgi:hypothetical protein
LMLLPAFHTCVLSSLRMVMMMMSFICSASYGTYLPKGIYGAWLLFFVSARTPATVTFTTRPAHTTTGWRELAGKTDVLSSANGPSTATLQQKCHQTSASAPSPSWPPMPGPSLLQAATVWPEQMQLPIAAEENFFVGSMSGVGSVSPPPVNPAFSKADILSCEVPEWRGGRLSH